MEHPWNRALTGRMSSLCDDLGLVQQQLSIGLMMAGKDPVGEEWRVSDLLLLPYLGIDPCYWIYASIVDVPQL